MRKTNVRVLTLVMVLTLLIGQIGFKPDISYATTFKYAMTSVYLFTADKDDSEKGYNYESRKQYEDGSVIVDMPYYGLYEFNISDVITVKDTAIIKFNSPSRESEGYKLIGIKKIVEEFNNIDIVINRVEEMLDPGTVECTIEKTKPETAMIGVSLVSIYENYMDVTKTELSSKIESYTSLCESAVEGSDIGMYEIGSKDLFMESINNANSILSDSASTIEQLEISLSSLEDAHNQFESKMLKEVDKVDLDFSINEASKVYDAAIVGVEVGQYTEEAKAELNNAINQALLVFSNTTASKDEVTSAKISMDLALAEFLSKAVKELDDGTDSDNDGISDWLESNGFIIESGRIKPWNGDMSVKHYLTDPLNWSTSGDPYSDKMKTLGLQMSNNVMQPARTNPYVAAYPNVKIRLCSMDIIPIATISDKSGGSTSEQITTSFTYKDEQTHKGSISVKNGIKVKVSTNPFELVAQEWNLEITTGYEGARNWGTTSTKTDSSTDSINWETARSVSSDKAAKIRLNMEYINNGTAPLKNVQAKFNIKLGNKVIASVGPNKWDTIPVADFLSTSDDPAHQTYGPFTMTHSSSGEIYLTMDELKAIQLGAPLTIEPIEILATVQRWDVGSNSWSDMSSWNVYNSEITSKTATLIYEDAIGRSKEFKIAAENSYYDPNLKLLDALAYTGNLETRDGQLFINGKALTDGWGFFFSDTSDVSTQLQTLESQGKGLLDLELKAGETFIISEPKDNSEPSISFARVSPDNKYIYAGVISGDYNIESVTAKLKINGVVTSVPLSTDDLGSLYFNKTEFSGTLDPAYAGTITVVDSCNNIVEKSITPSMGKDGLKYVPLDSTHDLMPSSASLNQTEGTYYASLDQYPNAEAVVVQVESNRWSSRDITVDVGDVSAELGTNDIRSKLWGLRVKDNNNKTYTIYGGDDGLVSQGYGYKEIKWVEDVGIPNDSIRSMELFGDPNFYVVAYEHSNFEGVAWNFDKNFDCALQNASDKISSFFIAPKYNVTQDEDGNYSTNLISKDLYVKSKNSPIISKTLVVPVDSPTLNIKWNVEEGKRSLEGQETNASINVKLVGYFAKDEGYNFTQVDMKSEFINGLNSRTNQIQGVSNAKGYLVEVRNHRISSDKVDVTVNGITHSFGTSDGKLYPVDSNVITNSDQKSPINSDIMFVPSNGSSVISVSTDISDWNTSSGDPRIEVKVLGYFSEFGDLVYKPYKLDGFFNPISSYEANETIDLSYAYLFRNLEPKAYLLNYKVFGLQKSPTIRRTFGDLTSGYGKNTTIDLGISSYDPKYDNVLEYPSILKHIEHSSMGYVPANISNPKIIESEGYLEDIGGLSEDLKIMGFFH